MTAKYSQEGLNLDYKNGTGADIAAGDILVLESLVGVAACDIPDGTIGAVAVHGVFLMPSAGDEVAVGAKVYLTSGGDITSTESGNTLAGYCAVEAKSTDTEIAVKLLG